ncbi:MAG TPA: hypothetical protein VLV78_08815 [Thermoanaerobaculia bacterium]|nr:hypothetical protein [Thermoanaerobaculia bacterium]
MRDEWSPLRLTTQQRIPATLGLLLLLAYAGATLYVGLHHEPWRDEADSWLLVNRASIPYILAWTHDAGTPALWYLVLKPLAWLHLPYIAQTLLNLAISWAAAAVLLFFAPLTRLTKLLLLASYYFAYEYSIVARSYSLTILLLFVALATFRRPIAFAVAVALLFNTNVHGGILAAALLVVFLAISPRNRTMIAPLAVMLIGALAAYLQLRPGTGSGNPAVLRAVNLYAVPMAVADGFLPGPFPPQIAVPLGFVLIAMVIVAVRRHRGALLFLSETLIGLATVYTVIWFGGLRHAGLFLIVIVAALWLASDVPLTNFTRAAAILLNLTLLGSAVYAFQNASLDMRFAFSGSKDMASFIDHRFDDYDIAAHNIYASEAVLPYLPGRKFWYIGLGDYGTFLKWDAAQGLGARMPYELAVDRARRHFRGRKWLLLLDTPMPQPERRGFRLIHATSVPVFRHLDERYWLYEPQ